MNSCREALRACRKTLFISLIMNVILFIIVVILAIVLAVPSNAGDEVKGIPESSHIMRAEYPARITESDEPQPAEPVLECIGTFKITAYCPCVKCCGIWSAEHPAHIGTDYIQKTASGTIPTEGRTVAADTSVLPYGTTIFIDDHEYTVEDCGGGIDGNSIDIFFESHEDALNWGVQNKNIYIKGDK